MARTGQRAVSHRGLDQMGRGPAGRGRRLPDRRRAAGEHPRPCRRPSHPRDLALSPWWPGAQGVRDHAPGLPGDASGSQGTRRLHRPRSTRRDHPARTRLDRRAARADRPLEGQRHQGARSGRPGARRRRPRATPVFLPWSMRSRTAASAATNWPARSTTPMRGGSPRPSSTRTRC